MAAGTSRPRCCSMAQSSSPAGRGTRSAELYDPRTGPGPRPGRWRGRPLAGHGLADAGWVRGRRGRRQTAHLRNCTTRQADMDAVANLGGGPPLPHGDTPSRWQVLVTGGSGSAVATPSPPPSYTALASGTDVPTTGPPSVDPEEETMLRAIARTPPRSLSGHAIGLAILCAVQAACVPPSAVSPSAPSSTTAVAEPTSTPQPATAVPSASRPSAPTQVDEPWIAYQWVQGGGGGIYLVVPMGRTRTRCSRMPSTTPSIPTGRRMAPGSPSTPKPVEATRFGSSTRTGPTPRRSCHGAPTARSVVVKSRSRPFRRTVQARVRPVQARRERSGGGRHRSPGRRQRRSAGLVHGTIEDGPELSALVLRWAVHRVRDTRYPDTQINPGTATGSAIAVIDVTGEGAEPVELTDWSMYATYPDWRPGSDEILFSTYDLGEFSRRTSRRTCTPSSPMAPV